MAYRIEFKASAAHELRRLSRDVQRRVLAKIAALAADPTPPGTRKIVGGENSYRIRVGVTAWSTKSSMQS